MGWSVAVPVLLTVLCVRLAAGVTDGPDHEGNTLLIARELKLALKSGSDGVRPVRGGVKVFRSDL